MKQKKKKLKKITVHLKTNAFVQTIKCCQKHFTLSIHALQPA